MSAELGGGITLNEANRIVYTPTTVNLYGIPLGGLLRLLGIKLTWLLGIEREGATLVDSQLELDHRKVFPPPAIEGKLAAASLTTAGLRLTFADNKAASFKPAPAESSSYLWMQSGDAKLFQTVVTNANVLVVSDKPDETLHFDLYGYRKQVAAGTLFMREDGTIIARLPSYSRMGAESATTAAAAAGNVK